MLPICGEIQLQLSRQYQQHTLAHAIILQGVAGTGKDALAQWLIELLICIQPKLIPSESNDEMSISVACGQCKTCLLLKSGSYPDHLLLASDNKTLGVDDVRNGNSFLEKTAQLGQVKTILIPQAQTMTVASANALLKTLEEPSANSFIVLLTDELESLLPTIVSRCAVYSIRPLIGQALLDQLTEQGSKLVSNDDRLTNTFANISQLAELTDEEIFKQYEKFSQSYLNYLLSGKSESELLSQLVDNKHGLRWLEKITCNLMRQQSLRKVTANGNTPYLDKNVAETIKGQTQIDISTRVLNEIYQAIINSNKLIKSYTQANRQFVAEQLLMMINDIVRTPT